MAGKEITTVGQEIVKGVNCALQRNTLERAKQSCLYFAGTVPGTLEKGKSTDTIKWRRYEAQTPNVNASLAPELGATNADLTFPTRSGSRRITVTGLTATVKKYLDFMYVTEEVNLFDYNDSTQEFTDIFGELAGRTLNILQRTEECDNSSQYYSAGAANLITVTSKLTINDITYIGNQLRRNSAEKFTEATQGHMNFGTTPIRAGYYAICHVDVEEDVRKMSNFKAAEEYAGQVSLEMGEFGSVGPFRFMSTEEAPVTANAGGAVGTTGLISTNAGNVDVYKTVFYGKRAFGSVGFGERHIKESYMVGDKMPVELISQPIGSAGAADVGREIGSLAIKYWHTAKVISPNDAASKTAWCRVVNSGATKLNA